MAAEPERSLPGYLAAVAAGTPAPGGGSVAAVTGALAAALGEMVANLTPTSTLAPDDAAALTTARERLTALRATLLAAAAADEAAYEGYRRAASLPKTSDREREARTAAQQEALIAATETPLAVARAVSEVATHLVTVATLGKRPLLSDAALGARLAEAALHGALLYVEVNVALLRDQETADAYRRAAEAIAQEGFAATADARERAERFISGSGGDAAR